MPLGFMTTRPVPGSRADTLPEVHATRLWRGSSKCNWTSSSLNFSSISRPSYSNKHLLRQPFHSGSFDNEALLIALHEFCKAIHIYWVGSYGRAIFPCKDCIG